MFPYSTKYENFTSNDSFARYYKDSFKYQALHFDYQQSFALLFNKFDINVPLLNKILKLNIE